MTEETKKLLLDEMLAGLARWLRAAGYDTLLASQGTDDGTLLAIARQQQRIFITRDRKISERRDASSIVLLLDCDGLENCAQELTDKANINWQMSPLSRCMECNTPIEPANPEHRNRVPDKGIDKTAPLFYCPRCDKVYWEGSHTRRIRHHLNRWSKQQFKQ